MSANRLLVVVALVLACLSFVVTGFPLIAVAVILLCIAQLG